MNYYKYFLYSVLLILAKSTPFNHYVYDNGELKINNSATAINIEFRDLSKFIMYKKEYAVKDIYKIHTLFQNNYELLFDLLENKPNNISIGNNSLSLYYILKIGKREYDIYLDIPEKNNNSSNKKMEKLILQNEYLSKKIFMLENEYKKSMVSNILLSGISDYEEYYELFEKLVSTDFDINCDLRLYSKGSIDNILYKIVSWGGGGSRWNSTINKYLDLILKLDAHVNKKTIDIWLRYYHNNYLDKYIKIFLKLVKNVNKHLYNLNEKIENKIIELQEQYDKQKNEHNKKIEITNQEYKECENTEPCRGNHYSPLKKCIGICKSPRGISEVVVYIPFIEYCEQIKNITKSSCDNPELIEALNKLKNMI